MGMIIDLAARFGGVEPDITKARKGKPDSGMDYRAWNKANPGHNPKGADGKWRGAGAMVSELMDVLRRHHGDGPNPLAAKLTEQVERAAHEAGLRSATRRGDLVRFDPDVHQISGRKPAKGTMVEVDAPGFDVPEWRMEGLEEATQGKTRLINVVPARVKRSQTAGEHDYDAKPRATARLTGRAEPDYAAMAAEIRGMPLLPESEAEIRAKLAPLTIPQLKALAGKADIPVSSKMRKPEIQAQIVDVLFGGRMTSDSVMNHEDKDRFNRRRAEVAAAAAAKGTSGMERLMGGKREAPGALKDEQGYRADAALIPDRAERRHHLAQAARMYGETPQEGIDRTNAQAQAMAESMGVDLSGLSKDKRGRYNLAEMLDAMADATGPGKAGRAPAAPAAPAAKVTAKPRTARAKVDMAAVDEEITAMIADPKPEHRGRLRTILGGMTVAQLQQIAEKHGSGILTGANKEEKRDRLVENVIGFRLNSLAIRGGAWTDDEARAAYRERALSVPSGEVKDWAQSVSNTLAGMTSTQEGKAFLGGFSKAQLLELAKEVGVRGGSSLTKPKLIDEITYMKIQGPRTLLRASGQERDADRAAKLRNAEALLDEMRGELIAQYGEDPDRWPEARQDHQVQLYWDQRERVDKLRQSAGKA